MISRDGQREGRVLSWVWGRMWGWIKTLEWRIDCRWQWIGLKAKEIKRGQQNGTLNPEMHSHVDPMPMQMHADRRRHGSGNRYGVGSSVHFTPIVCPTDVLPAEPHRIVDWNLRLQARIAPEEDHGFDWAQHVRHVGLPQWCWCALMTENQSLGKQTHNPVLKNEGEIMTNRSKPHTA